MKYNPDYHSSVVRNLRSLFAEELPHTQLRLSDEQIWGLFENYGSCEAMPDEFPDLDSRYDACILVAMRDNN